MKGERGRSLKNTVNGSLSDVTKILTVQRQEKCLQSTLVIETFLTQRRPPIDYDLRWPA